MLTRVLRGTGFTLSLFLPALLFAADDGHGAKASDPVIPQTVWAILSFLVVLFILWKKAIPPILGAMDSRAEKIREALAAADQAKADAEAAMAAHQDNLETARQESRSIIEEGKRDAEKVKAQIIEDASQEAGEISQRVTREIQLAKEAALDDLHKRSVSLSIDLAGKLIQKNLSAKENQKLIDKTVKDFSEN
jgi:F-type H+-transporting ATPase subunit b